VAFLEGRLISSQSEIFEYFLNCSDWLVKSSKKHFCFDHVNRLIVFQFSKYINARMQVCIVHSFLQKLLSTIQYVVDVDLINLIEAY